MIAGQALVLLLAAFAITATGAPYEWRAVERQEVSSLDAGRSTRAYRITACGPEPYDDSGWLEPDPLFAEPQRTELHIFVAGLDGVALLTVRRGDWERAFEVDPRVMVCKVFDFDLKPLHEGDGRYCDESTELTLEAVGTTLMEVHWRAELVYLADLDADLDIRTTLAIEEVE